jgi:hypothetical protein
MELSLSTQLAQQALSDQVSAAVTAKGLDAQKQDGQNVLQLIASAAPAFEDPALGRRIDVRA